MGDTISQQQILGSWVHSHEEDRDGNMVFRSASFPFPPSRGRRGFTLEEGGELEIHQPGRDDRSVRSSGAWTLEGNVLTINAPNWSRSYLIKSTDGGTLVLQPR